MSEHTEIATDTAGAMAPADVPDRLVQVALDNYLPGLHETGEEAMRECLAAVLPLYGAAVIVNAGVEHYERQEALATSLTTRVYGASLLQGMAREAEIAAAMGMAPALNTELAHMLRERARREAKP